VLEIMWQFGVGVAGGPHAGGGRDRPESRSPASIDPTGPAGRGRRQVAALERPT
jgi:hypothetical protein